MKSRTIRSRSARGTPTRGEQRLQLLRAFVEGRHGGICLAEHYQTQKARYPFRCAQGHDFTASAANVLHRGSWCPQCAGNESIAGEHLVQLIERRGGRWISGDRTEGGHSQIRVQCENGHEFSLTLDWLRAGRLAWCPQCKQERSRGHQHTELCDAASAVGHRLVSTAFVDRRTQVQFDCPIGHRWSASPDAFRRFGGCRVCRSLLERSLPPLEPQTIEPAIETTNEADRAIFLPSLRLITALSALLDLPREPREATINAGQLRLLVLLDQAHRDIADRDRARDLDGHEKPTVDNRLQTLRSKGLVRPSAKDRYHDAAHHRPTPTGRLIVQRLCGARPHAGLIEALDRVCALPIRQRESVANASILSVLARVAIEPGVTAPAIIRADTRLGTKETTRFRLAWLERHTLVERLPRYNAGGHGSPNRYRATASGRSWVRWLSPPAPSTGELLEEINPYVPDGPDRPG